EASGHRARSAVALVQGLRGLLLAGRLTALSEQTSAEALEATSSTFFQCLDELTELGIDADSLLRYGLYAETIAPLLIENALIGLLDDSHKPTLSSETLSGWRRILSLGPTFGGSIMNADDVISLGSQMDPILRWAFYAAPRDLYMLTPPTPEQLVQA